MNAKHIHSYGIKSSLLWIANIPLKIVPLSNKYQNQKGKKKVDFTSE